MSSYYTLSAPGIAMLTTGETWLPVAHRSNVGEGGKRCAWMCAVR